MPVSAMAFLPPLLSIAGWFLFVSAQSGALPDFEPRNPVLAVGLVTFNIANADAVAFSGTLPIRYAWVNGDDGEISSLAVATTTSIGAFGSVRMSSGGPFIAAPPPAAARLRIAVNPAGAGAVAESRFENNAIDVDRSLPNLQVESPTIMSAGLRFSVTNRGAAALMGTSVRVRFIRLRADGSQESSEDALYAMYLPPVTGTFTTTRAGAYYSRPPDEVDRFRIIVDPDNAIAESGGGTNNERELVIGHPDFVIETPPTLTASSLSYVMANRGLRYFSNTLTRSLTWLDAAGNALTSTTVSDTVTLSANTVSTPYTLSTSFITSPPIEARRLVMVLDSSNTYIEENDGNNTVEVVRLLPDLTITPALLDATSVTYDVRNIGAADFSGRANFAYEWLADDGTVVNGRIEFSVTLIVPQGGSLTRSYSAYDFIANQPVGARRLRITVAGFTSLGASIAEDAANNNATIDSTRTVSMDLSIETATLVHNTLRFTVRNAGDGTAVAGTVRSRYVWLDASGAEIGTALTAGPFVAYAFPSGLSAEIVRSLSSLPTRPAGTARLRIMINPSGYGHLPETDETNNSRDVDPEYYDFMVDSAVYADSVVTYVTRNAGNASFSGALRHRFEWVNESGGTVGSLQIPSPHYPELTPGATVEYTFSADSLLGTPAGRTAVRVTVNPDYSTTRVTEWDYANNSRDAVPPRPDFHIASFSYGETTGVNYTVTNEGDSGFHSGFTIRYRWLDAGANEVASSDVSAASFPGTSVTLSRGDLFIFQPGAAARRLEVTVNPSGIGHIGEDDATDNSFTIDRPLPDLTFGTITLHYDTASMEIRNVGTGDWTVRPVTVVSTWLDANGGELTADTWTSAPITILDGSSITRTPVSPSTFFTRPPEGAVRLRARLTIPEDAPESNLGNDEAIAEPSFPNFSVENARFDGLAIALDVRNSGPAAFSSGPLRVGYRWLRDETELTSTVLVSTAAIPVGGTASVRGEDPTIGFPPDEAAEIEITVNPEHLVGEADYGNNRGRLPLPLPDLAPLNPGMAGYTASYRIENRGDRDFALILPVRYTWLDTNGSDLGQLERSDYLTIPQGGGVDRTFNFLGSRPPARAARLRVELNYLGSIQESDFANDTFVIDRNLPDVSLEAASFNDFGVLYVFRNRGTYDLSGALAQRLSWLDGDLNEISSMAVSNTVILPAGGPSYYMLINTRSLGAVIPGTPTGLPTFSIGQTGDFISAPPAGAAWLRIGVDADDAYYESNDFNNVFDLAYAAPGTTGEDMADADEDAAAEGIAADIIGEEEEPSPSPSAASTPTPSASASPSPSASASPIVSRLPTPVINPLSTPFIIIPGIAPIESIAPFVTSPRGTIGPRITPRAAINAVLDPRILPGNPLYLVRRAGRAIHSAFTFDEEAQTGLHLRYANERMLELNRLADLGEHDRVARYASGAVRELGRAQNALQALQGEDPQAAARVAARIFQSEVRQQVLFGRFEREAPAEHALRVSAAREEALQRVRESAQLIQEPEALLQAVHAALPQRGSAFQAIRHAEVLNAVAEAVPSHASPVIHAAAEAAAERFGVGLSIVPETVGLHVNAYIAEVGGNAGRYIEALDRADETIVGAPAFTLLAGAQETAVRELGERVTALGAESPQAAEAFMRPLADGSLEGIRALHDIEARVDPAAARFVAPARETAIARFKKTVEAHTAQNTSAAFAGTVAGNHSDVKQLVVLQEIRTRAPQLEQTLNAIETKTVEAIIGRVNSARAPEERQAVLKAVSNASLNAVPVIEARLAAQPELRDALLKTQRERDDAIQSAASSSPPLLTLPLPTVPSKEPTASHSPKVAPALTPAIKISPTPSPILRETASSSLRSSSAVPLRAPASSSPGLSSPAPKSGATPRPLLTPAPTTAAPKILETPTPTLSPAVTLTPKPTATPTPAPTETSKPAPTPTTTPTPTPSPTATPKATPAPTTAPTPTPTPTATPKTSPTPTPTPKS